MFFLSQDSFNSQQCLLALPHSALPSLLNSNGFLYTLGRNWLEKEKQVEPLFPEDLTSTLLLTTDLAGNYSLTLQFQSAQETQYWSTAPLSEGYLLQQIVGTLMGTGRAQLFCGPEVFPCPAPDPRMKISDFLREWQELYSQEKQPAAFFSHFYEKWFRCPLSPDQLAPVAFPQF